MGGTRSPVTDFSLLEELCSGALDGEEGDGSTSRSGVRESGLQEEREVVNALGVEEAPR